MIEDISLILPPLIVAFGGLILMFLSAFNKIKLQNYNLLAIAFLTLAFVIELPRYGSGERFFAFSKLFFKMYIVDDFSILFDLMFLLGAVFTLLVNSVYLKKRKYYSGEFFALILFSIFGMMTLAHSNELISAFIALELASISIYALVGYHKNNPLSGEAMFKYLVLGSFTSSFFILGSALIYGAVDSTNIYDIASFVSSSHGEKLIPVYMGATLIMITILFKIGAAPFHAWVLDVYHGAPFPVTMFMASTFKIALFAIALRIYLVDFKEINALWSSILQVITILTLLIGSWLAYSQKVLKRMLSGSSIVHSGYMLIALSSVGLGAKYAAPAIMFYLIAYFLSSVGAFGILSFLSSDAKRQFTYDDFKGFAQQRPYLAAMMAVFMLSLSGFPSTIGFLGKFYIFTSAIEAGEIALAALGIITAFISVYYYFKLIAVMYFYSSDDQEKKFEFSISTVLIGTMAIIIIWGGIGTSLFSFIPGADGLIDIAKQAIESLR